MGIDIESFQLSRTTQGIKVPAPIDLVDLEKAIASARNIWIIQHDGALPADDVIRVTTDENYIAIHWTDEEQN